MQDVFPAPRLIQTHTAGGKAWGGIAIVGKEGILKYLFNLLEYVNFLLLHTSILLQFNIKLLVSNLFLACGA